MKITAEIMKKGPLTDREAQVLHLVCEGNPVKGIARNLGISPKTAGHHIDQIQSKLAARSLLQTALIAISDGMVRVGRFSDAQVRFSFGMLQAGRACGFVFCLFVGAHLWMPHHSKQNNPVHRHGHVRIAHPARPGNSNTHRQAS
jgi:DNA-binding CsgD family transcriptional regulator